MWVVDIAQLMRMPKALVIAPPGYGKTHLMAQAVAECGGKRELILTHTHAGVHSIRQKLRKFGVSSNRVQVDTISGWLLRYLFSFPSASGFTSGYPSTSQGWSEIYCSGLRLFQLAPLTRVLRASYSGVLVDEYQDCTDGQHELIVLLAELLPTRLFGDPWQGIFEFNNSTPLDWNDVNSLFSIAGTLEIPRRWEQANPELGAWLDHVRQALDSGESVDLRSGPRRSIQWVNTRATNFDRRDTFRACYSVAGQDGTATVIFGPREENQSVGFAKSLAGRYQVIEPVECKKLMTVAGQLDQLEGHELARTIVELAVSCATGLATPLGSIRKNLRDGRTLAKIRSHRDVVDAVEKLSRQKTPSSMAGLLKVLLSIEKASVYRRELLDEISAAIALVDSGEHDSYFTAARARREFTRRLGRRLYRHSIGRTLLVKGLEFDHAILMLNSAWGIKDIYVALTRATRTITIFSDSPIVGPSDTEAES